MANEENLYPSILKMVKSFTKDLSKYIKEGAKNVTAMEYAVRLDTCNACEFLKKASMRCGKCGCLLEHKAKWSTADCPENKWPAQKGIPKKEVLDRETRNKLADERDAKRRAENAKK